MTRLYLGTGFVVAAVLAVGAVSCGDGGELEAAGDTTTPAPADVAPPDTETAGSGGQADACSLLNTEQLESFLVGRGVADAVVARDEALPAMTCGYRIDGGEQGTGFVQVTVLDGGDYDSLVASYPDAEALEELPDLGERAVRFIAEDGPFVVIQVDRMSIVVSASGGLDPGESDYGFAGVTALAEQVVERVRLWGAALASGDRYLVRVHDRSVDVALLALIGVWMERTAEGRYPTSTGA